MTDRRTDRHRHPIRQVFDFILDKGIISEKKVWKELKERNSSVKHSLMDFLSFELEHLLCGKYSKLDRSEFYDSKGKEKVLGLDSIAEEDPVYVNCRVTNKYTSDLSCYKKIRDPSSQMHFV